MSFGEDIYPESVESAATKLVSSISAEDKQEIIGKKKIDLIMYHHGWGTGIRNNFGLWKGNSKLLEDCGSPTIHPDECSMIIIERVWVKLRDSVSKEEIEGIDKINSLLEEITISAYRKKKTGAIEYIKFLNSEIAKTEYGNELFIHVKCTSDHYRLKDFYSDIPQNLSRVLGYFRGQMLAKITVTKNQVVLTPLPFKDSEPCNA